ncbi:golgin subfamily A member 6-like protein 22 [Saccostrea cucullata]|uniref:golgin subfamily A member 6-like protein 22 n=1 Tax=Saccostrea cuccullata TaxID=36930 RepID=UPI002ED43A63
MSKVVMKPKKGVKSEPGEKKKQESKNKKSYEEEAEEMRRKTDELLEKERNGFLEQIAELIKELERLRKENEKLRKQQEEKMGVTAEVVDKMKRDLEHSKTTNSFLLRDVEDRKSQIARMESQLFEMTMKVEGMSKKVSEVSKSNTEYKHEIEELVKEKSRAERLWDENRKLRRFLAANHIDSRTGKPLLEMYRDKKLSQNKKVVRIKETIKSRSMQLANRRLLRPSKSLDDLRKLEEYYETKSTKSEKSSDSEPAPYIGHYMDIMKKRKTLQQKKL